MEDIVRNVRDIDAGDRYALEHVVGQTLRDNQRLIIQITEIDLSGRSSATDAHASPIPAGKLPAWCNVYEGLSDKEIEEIEEAVLDRDHWTRDSA